MAQSENSDEIVQKDAAAACENAKSLIDSISANNHEPTPNEFEEFKKNNDAISKSKCSELKINHYKRILEQVRKTQNLTRAHGVFLGTQRHFKNRCLKRGFDTTTEMLQPPLKQLKGFSAP
jgi:hypothetical protein